MKKIRSYLLVLILLTAGVSCKKTFLDEEPVDFLSTTNAFKTVADFNASVNNLYRLMREEFYTLNDNGPMDYLYRTDLGIDVTAATPNLEAQINPNNVTVIRDHWIRFYKIVSEANTVISRIPESQLTANEKLLFEARGRFFRAVAYRSLAYLYGGVPLQTTEVTEPKVDFTRATRKEVYAQAIQDLQFAAANLPSLAAAASVIKDGEVSSQAANHLLAEVYIADGQFQNAVTAASAVINSPGMALMTARFGGRKTEVPGDVYSDLFRVNNQNRRSAANTEAILVIQIQTDIQGGAAASTLGFANTGGYCMERVHTPLVRDVLVNNVAPFLWPAGDYTGGRGVGFLAPSAYFINTLYQSSASDIRNANHNFVRKFKSNNPASPFYNTEIDFAALPAGTKGTNGVTLTSGVPSRAFYPYQAKATTPYEHPTGLYAPQSGAGARAWPFSLKDGAGFTYRDEYMFRLAETYLLRAEAYLGLTNTTAAATDINVVRARAAATAVLPADVNIDYILDERLRELGVEEKRMLTLMRLGKWYDRIIKCNPYYAPQANTKFNLWPIPQSEIERNRNAVLTQNTGY